MATARLVIVIVTASAAALVASAGNARGEDAGATNPCADPDEAVSASPAGEPSAELASGAPADREADARYRDVRACTTSPCIDAVLADRLAVKRQRRAAVDRLFVKQARHELSAGGGYYVSDLYSGSYIANAAYTYHMTETTAVELAVAVTYANAEIIRALEEGRGAILDDERSTMLMAESLLIFTPVYGKFRLGGKVMRFDLHLDAGFGVVDAPTSRGLSAVAGAGVKLFVSESLAVRFDARDHIHHQQLLDSSFLVNDLSLTFGLSLLFPTRN